MKFGVIVFPGSNCDDDMVYVLRDIMQQEVVKLWHKDTDLQACDFLIVPGGFSYGDYLRSGAIARFSPIMESLNVHVKKGGYVLGICNGFQILTEAHLLEGALLKNENQKYICKNIYLKAKYQKNIITQGLNSEQAYQIPIAHGEGRFYANENTLKKLQDKEQILFQYCDKQGSITSEANPNGSLKNIAGISNEEGNVIGMMPHPERASTDLLGNIDGRVFFESILQNIKV